VSCQGLFIFLLRYARLPVSSPLFFQAKLKGKGRRVKGREQEVISNKKIKALEAAGWYSCFLPYGLRAVDSSPPSTPKGR